MSMLVLIISLFNIIKFKYGTKNTVLLEFELDFLSLLICIV